MGKQKPLVVVSGSSKGSRSAWQASRILLGIHGAQSRFVHPNNWSEEISMDGLLLLGGVDIDPALYGGKPHPSIMRIEPERDHMELQLLQYAKRENLPVMGICRGMQMINLSYGGTLLPHIGDLELDFVHHKTLFPMKRVNVIDGTRLHAIFDSHRVKVNALHHQTVERLGVGLRKAAHDRNGIIQAIEHNEVPFVMGVQWHPEFMPYMWHTQRLFDAFVRAARV